MKKLAIKKLSVLGLVLMAVSAVTAAVLPNKSDLRHGNDNGTLRTGIETDDASPLRTCVTNDNGGAAVCTITAASAAASTDAVAGGESTVSGFQTQGNTSQTAGVAGNQQSVLIEV